MSGRATSSDAIAMRPFEASLPMALLQAREATMRVFRPLIGEHDLTEQQWRVLRALAASDEPLDVGTVAARTFLLAPSLSRILAKLESRSLIERHLATDDQRRSNLVLSRAGRDLVQRVAPVSEAAYNAIEEGFGTNRLHTLIGELDELTALLHETGTEP